MTTDVHHFTTTAPTACSCQDYLYRPARRPCKHVRRLVDAQDLIATQTAYNENRRAA